MAIAAFSNKFKEIFLRIKDSLIKARVIKQIEKLKLNPEQGKPMRYDRRGTRELRIPPFRLSYAYLKSEDKIVILDLYYKDEQ